MINLSQVMVTGDGYVNITPGEIKLISLGQGRSLHPGRTETWTGLFYPWKSKVSESSWSTASRNHREQFFRLVSWSSHVYVCTHALQNNISFVAKVDTDVVINVVSCAVRAYAVPLSSSVPLRRTQKSWKLMLIPRPCHCVPAYSFCSLARV